MIVFTVANNNIEIVGERLGFTAGGSIVDGVVGAVESLAALAANGNFCVMRPLGSRKKPSLYPYIPCLKIQS